MISERDDASGRMLAWPEGTPGAVVEALRGMSGRQLAAKDEESKKKKEEEKKARQEEQEEEKREQEEEIEAVRYCAAHCLPCVLHVAVALTQLEGSICILRVHCNHVCRSMKESRWQVCFI
jgi:hypothetical protein